MQQIYRKAPMPKCDFNGVTKRLYWNRTSAWVFSFKFAAYFQNTFSQEHHWVAASLFLTGDCSFSQYNLSEMRTGSFCQEFRCSVARIKFKTGVLSRIFNCSTEHLDLPVHCKCPSVSSSRIKKKAIVFPGSQQIPHKTPQYFR